EVGRLQHRYRGVHADGARQVAGGRDPAAFPPADDQRLVVERGVVALLDRGVERVAIDMRDRERIELRMMQRARRPAGRAARPGAGKLAQTVAAEARHGDSLALRYLPLP